jgi:hypothetical protein
MGLSGLLHQAFCIGPLHPVVHPVLHPALHPALHDPAIESSQGRSPAALSGAGHGRPGVGRLRDHPFFEGPQMR